MKNLSSIFCFFVLTIPFNAKAQEQTVSEKLTTVDEKANGILERLATDEADLSKLTKIKISGYMQAQYQNFQSPALLSASQNIVDNEKVGTVGKVVDNYVTALGIVGTLDWSSAINQNVFTLRLQAKF